MSSLETGTKLRFVILGTSAASVVIHENFQMISQPVGSRLPKFFLVANLMEKKLIFGDSAAL